MIEPSCQFTRYREGGAPEAGVQLRAGGTADLKAAAALKASKSRAQFGAAVPQPYSSLRARLPGALSVYTAN